MSATSLPTQGVLYEAAEKLLAASLAYWTIYQATLGPDAVVWLKGDDDRLVVITRGEYTETLMENIGQVREAVWQERQP
jgi:hypothetical protein